MAQESCDLKKDEAEILKPSSSSSPSPSPTTTSTSPPTAQMPEPPPPQSTPPTPPAAAAATTPQFLTKTCEGILIEASKKRKLAEAAATDANAAVAAVAAEPLSPVLFVNRCNVCRKRVGLTGFRCRCEKLFCPRHRHSETHECSFDYKTAGREEIARANPVIRAAKIIKI